MEFLADSDGLGILNSVLAIAQLVVGIRVLALLRLQRGAEGSAHRIFVERVECLLERLHQKSRASGRTAEAADGIFRVPDPAHTGGERLDRELDLDHPVQVSESGRNVEEDHGHAPGSVLVCQDSLRRVSAGTFEVPVGHLGSMSAFRVEEVLPEGWVRRVDANGVAILRQDACDAL